jgi:hypothetical protein
MKNSNVNNKINENKCIYYLMLVIRGICVFSLVMCYLFLIYKDGPRRYRPERINKNFVEWLSKVSGGRLPLEIKGISIFELGILPLMAMVFFFLFFLSNQYINKYKK